MVGEIWHPRQAPYAWAMAIAVTSLLYAPAFARVNWALRSSTTGDLPTPNEGSEQTCCVVCDIDRDGVDDFVVGERTKAPSVVWYKYNGQGWDKRVIDAGLLHPEAGGDVYDIDKDGDLDIMIGEMGDPGAGDQANIYLFYGDGKGNFEQTIAWHGQGIHEGKFGDFDGDGDLDILLKPYHHKAPRIDILLNAGPVKASSGPG